MSCLEKVIGSLTNLNLRKNEAMEENKEILKEKTTPDQTGVEEPESATTKNNRRIG